MATTNPVLSENMFYSYLTRSARTLPMTELAYGNNKEIMYVIDLKKDVIHAPMALVSIIRNCILSYLRRTNNTEVSDIVFPFMCAPTINGIFSRRTSKAIIRWILNSRHTSLNSFYLVPTELNDTIYYCSAGMIFNKDLEPLMILAIDFSAETEETFVPYIYISRNTFVNQDDPLEKYILKNILPWMAVTGVTNKNRTTEKIHPKIVIGDDIPFLIKPKLPNVKTIDELQVLISNHMKHHANEISKSCI